jgi:hypothetical protein
MSDSGVTGQNVTAVEPSTGPKPDAADRKQTARYDYVFSRDGGEVGTFLMRGPVIPDNAIIADAYIDTIVVPTSDGAASIGLGVVSTTDINSEDTIDGAPWSTAAQHDADAAPDPGDDAARSNYIKLTSALGLQMTIGTAALTAGQFAVVVTYDITE